MLSGGPCLGSDEQFQFQPTLTNGRRHVVQDAERRNDVFLGMNAGNFIDCTVKALHSLAISSALARSSGRV